MSQSKIIAVIITSQLLIGCLTTRSQIKEQSKLQTEVATLQETKADNEARNQEFEAQLRDFNGRIEVLEGASREIKEKAVSIEEQKKLDAELLENKFKVIQDALLKVESELQLMSDEIQKIKRMKRSVKKSSSSAKLGNYSQAEIDFSRKKWKEAAVGYQKYRDLNPKGRRYSDSTYKIGVCFQEMGMKSEARAFYEEVIEKFPKSRMADKAKYRLKTLK